MKNNTKNEQQKVEYFFVDEAGDPTFFNRCGENIVGKDGCSKILILGFIRTNDPDELRNSMSNLHNEIDKDPFYEGVPSLEKTKICFHAKDDIPEIREKVYRKIATLNFKAEFFVARKIQALFLKRHLGKENLFYDDLISKLFENKLHKSEKNIIYFATRGSKTRQKPLEEAIQKATLTFEKKWGIKIDGQTKVLPQSPIGEPCLQIIDYMNWAVHRAFTKKEDRFYKFIEEKISYLVDVYDFDNYKKNYGNYYNRKNKFDITKISPL
jgi:hypothetical protein